MKFIFSSLAIVIALAFISWRSSPVDIDTTSAKSKAQKIIDKAIKVHGGKIINNSKISFDFREKHYVATRDNGQYTYERIFTDKEGQNVHDKLNNTTLTRSVNGQKVDLSEKDKAAYTNSVNSVIYFVMLPYFLNDAAVIKNYLGEEIISNRAYHKIKVTFQQEGGGKDFDDEYIYWIHKEKYTMDYLAYNYQVDGGGARFRSAYNVRKIKGIRFADYINSMPIEKDNHAVETFGQLFQKKQLKELSKIETENIEVDILK